MATAKVLTLDDLKTAVAGSAAAFRLTLKLEAVSPKVFPLTYEGGKYATEERIIGGAKLPCVLLDSVPSQANRMELALQEAVLGSEIELPVVSTDFLAVENPRTAKSDEPASAATARNPSRRRTRTACSWRSSRRGVKPAKTPPSTRRWNGSNHSVRRRSPCRS